jgi:hypothetical protein
MEDGAVVTWGSAEAESMGFKGKELMAPIVVQRRAVSALRAAAALRFAHVRHQ